jgi:hypothetical protein
MNKKLNKNDKIGLISLHRQFNITKNLLMDKNIFKSTFDWNILMDNIITKTKGKKGFIIVVIEA